MPPIESGRVIAYFLFDVAETIRLDALRSAVGTAARDTQFTTRIAAPTYVQYQPPPITLSGHDLGFAQIEGFAATFKFYEYGVISVGLTMEFRGTWDELVVLGQSVAASTALAGGAQRACERVVQQVKRAIVGARASFLTEDYFVFLLRQLDPPQTAHRLLADHGADIARLLRGERHPLSHEEREDVLRHRLSYFPEDVIIPTWQSAFVYDNDDPGAVLEIIEFANSQLLEFRYYDDLLDDELTRVYGQVQRLHWYDSLVGGRHGRAARRLHSVFIDTTDLADRTENALKMVGDVYAARVFNLVASRVGLDAWKAAVREKLKTLDNINGFLVDQVSMTRAHFLELTIIAILLFELGMFLAGIR
jgi:hypothetical protein